MNTRVLRTTALLLTIVLFLMIPVPGAFAAEDDEGTNKGVLVGVFVVVLGVLAWLGLRSDMERWQSSETQTQPYRYPGEFRGDEIQVTGKGALRAEPDPMMVMADGLRVSF